MNKKNATIADDLNTLQKDWRWQNVLHRLVDDGPEKRAIEAGEIDALIDYKDKHIILFPVAERALRAARGSTFTPDPLTNAILASLPVPEYQRLRHDLEPVKLTANDLLQESGAPIRYVYFPIDGVISLLATVESRRVLEVALVGSEGMVGLSLALGVNVSPVRALVGIAGSAVRLPELQFREVYRQNPALREELNRFTYTELAVARQAAACCAFHMIEQRFARRLLMIVDRLHSDRFFCTHEAAAYALGVRRESISQVAGTLQHRGLISYRRGHVRVLNRRGLESVACNCYTRISRRPMQAVLQASV
jgi:CRP-like cAMP-binding protein